MMHAGPGRQHAASHHTGCRAAELRGDARKEAGGSRTAAAWTLSEISCQLGV